ncbi:MAG: hypothetical protein HRT86_05490 [Ilumatobacteraceae bacterium]|nr:hypothetical protein [Ilumatobacteraceae bacterium]
MLLIALRTVAVRLFIRLRRWSPVATGRRRVRRCRTAPSAAWEIERIGLVGHEAAKSDTVDFATTRPVSRVLLDVLGDTGAPDVVRIRAFGKLALQLARNPR